MDNLRTTPQLCDKLNIGPQANFIRKYREMPMPPGIKLGHQPRWPEPGLKACKGWLESRTLNQ